MNIWHFQSNRHPQLLDKNWLLSSIDKKVFGLGKEHDDLVRTITRGMFPRKCGRQQSRRWRARVITNTINTTLTEVSTWTTQQDVFSLVIKWAVFYHAGHINRTKFQYQNKHYHQWYCDHGIHGLVEFAKKKKNIWPTVNRIITE